MADNSGYLTMRRKEGASCPTEAECKRHAILTERFCVLRDAMARQLGLEPGQLQSLVAPIEESSEAGNAQP